MLPHNMCLCSGQWSIPWIGKRIHKEALQQKDIEYKNELQEKLNERDTEHSKVVSDLKIEFEAKDKIISQLSDDTVELQYQADSSSQYNRKDNIKITGVPYE